MQASKIIPKHVYAITLKSKVGGAVDLENLARYRVTEVLTVRKGESGPSAYHSVVKGEVDARDVPEDFDVSQLATLSPESILGPFEAYKEPVAKRDAERAAVKAKEDAEKALRLKLARAFYRL